MAGGGLDAIDTFPRLGWLTGWFNLVGLVGVVACVDYGCATFMNATFMLFGVDLRFADWGDTSHVLTETFLLFVAILTLHALINIHSSPLVALLNTISVFWHVAGVAAIILVLAIVPDTHQSVDFVFTETINSSGFGGGMFWLYVLPLGMACVTSCSRMMYAFSRDRAVPGWRLWTRLNHHRVPALAVIASCVAAALMTAPALEGDEAGAPYAFFAVVSICVIGLYIAYEMPVYLRWRMGDAFEPGPWTLGRKYRWINPAAIIWVGICVIIFCLPFTPAAVPWRDEFDEGVGVS